MPTPSSLYSILDRLRTSLLVLPAAFAGAATTLAFVLVRIDHELSADPATTVFLFSGSAEAARTVLSTIAQSMLTFTGLVFTITMLVLQLASGQLSPRVMRTFLRDRATQVVLGLFVATFVFTLLVLREVRGNGGEVDQFVPGASIWVAFLLLLACVGAFIFYIDHVAHGIRASTVIMNIWRDATGAIERLYPERIAEGAVDEPELDRSGDARVVRAPSAGYVVGLDDERLVDAVRGGDRRVEILPQVGQFVPEGAAIARAWGRWDDAAIEAVTKAVGIGPERTLDQDAAFAFRQLVDVALRAASPSTSDPTTASQAIDRLHDLLRRLARRDFPSPVRVSDGRPVVRTSRPGWEDYVRLAFDEIIHLGAGQPQVLERLRRAIDDLLAVAPDDRRPPLRLRGERVDAALAALPLDPDRATATAAR